MTGSLYVYRKNSALRPGRSQTSGAVRSRPISLRRSVMASGVMLRLLRSRLEDIRRELSESLEHDNQHKTDRLINERDRLERLLNG